MSDIQNDGRTYIDNMLEMSRILDIQNDVRTCIDNMLENTNNIKFKDMPNAEMSRILGTNINSTVNGRKDYISYTLGLINKNTNKFNNADLSLDKVNSTHQNEMAKMNNIIIGELKIRGKDYFYQNELNRHLGLDNYFVEKLNGIKNSKGKQYNDNTFLLANQLQIMEHQNIITKKRVEGKRNVLIVLNENYPEYIKSDIVIIPKQKSKFQYEIEGYLCDLKITFEIEKSFPDCKFKNVLPFDIIISSSNNTYNKIIFIEIQGEQHFKAVSIFGGEKALLEQQKRDKIKKEYAISKGHFIEIKYDVKDKKKYLIDELKKINYIF
jgi:hypothetical protein